MITKCAVHCIRQMLSEQRRGEDPGLKTLGIISRSSC